MSLLYRGLMITARKHPNLLVWRKIQRKNDRAKEVRDYSWTHKKKWQIQKEKDMGKRQMRYCTKRGTFGGKEIESPCERQDFA